MPTLDLMQAIKLATCTFLPQWRQELARQAGGSPRVADLGPPVWLAKIQSVLMTQAQATDVAAIVNQLGGSLGTFYVWDPRRPYPKLDPTGSILGASVVTIATLGVDNKSIALAGLPAGYKISRGDKIAWDFGSPAHRAFHEFCAAATADGAGALPLTEITPHLRTGATVGTQVILKKAAAEMMIQPGSYDFPSGRRTSSISFTAIEVP